MDYKDVHYDSKYQVVPFTGIKSKDQLVNSYPIGH
jgi:hypothetical protein